MSPLETINQASQQLLTASPSQATGILRQLVEEFSNGSYLVTSGNIVDEIGTTTPDFEAIIHTQYKSTPKHPSSIPADAASVAFCIYDNMTIADLRAAYDKIKQAKSLKKKPAEWDISVWTEGQTPDVLFWDDTTGHLFFKINLLKRIVKWHPDNGFAGYVDNVALSAGWTLQSDYAFPQKGRLWSAGDLKATLVDLVSMRIEKTIDLMPFLPTYATHFSGCYEKFTHSVIIMTNDGEVKYPLERYGSDQVPLSSILKDLCEKAGLAQTDTALHRGAN